MKIFKLKVIWYIKSVIFKQKTVLTKISLNSHSTKKRSRFRHPYRFMNLDFLAHFGILVNRSLSSAPRSMTFLTFGTYLVNYCHPSMFPGNKLYIISPIFHIFKGNSDTKPYIIGLKESASKSILKSWNKFRIIHIALKTYPFQFFNIKISCLVPSQKSWGDKKSNPLFLR